MGILSCVKYRVKDIEEVIFSGQSHVMGHRRPDNQFLFIGQIGLISQQVSGYMVDMDFDSIRADEFSLCRLFICRSVKKCNPLMWSLGKRKLPLSRSSTPSSSFCLSHIARYVPEPARRNPAHCCDPDVNKFCGMGS